MMLQLYRRPDEPGVDYCRVVDRDGKVYLDATVRQLIELSPWTPQHGAPLFSHLWTCAVTVGVDRDKGLSPSDALFILRTVTQQLTIDP